MGNDEVSLWELVANTQWKTRLVEEQSWIGNMYVFLMPGIKTAEVLKRVLSIHPQDKVIKE